MMEKRFFNLEIKRRHVPIKKKNKFSERNTSANYTNIDLIYAKLNFRMNHETQDESTTNDIFTYLAYA